MKRLRGRKGHAWRIHNLCQAVAELRALFPDRRYTQFSADPTLLKELWRNQVTSACADVVHAAELVARGVKE